MCFNRNILNSVVFQPELMHGTQSNMLKYQPSRSSVIRVIIVQMHLIGSNCEQLRKTNSDRHRI